MFDEAHISQTGLLSGACWISFCIFTYFLQHRVGVGNQHSLRPDNSAALFIPFFPEKSFYFLL